MHGTQFAYGSRMVNNAQPDDKLSRRQQSKRTFVVRPTDSNTDLNCPRVVQAVWSFIIVINAVLDKIHLLTPNLLNFFQFGLDFFPILRSTIMRQKRKANYTRTNSVYSYDVLHVFIVWIYWSVLPRLYLVVPYYLTGCLIFSLDFRQVRCKMSKFIIKWQISRCWDISSIYENKSAKI